MPLVHDTPTTFLEIFTEVQTNVYDAGLKWYSEEDILLALQEAYNRVVALLCPIEHATFIPEVASPYYNLAAQIPNFMYVAGIYNVQTNLWLEGMSYKLMKATYQTYLAIGEAKFFSPIDLRRSLIWPFPAADSGVLFVVFKERAPVIDLGSIPILPYSVGKQVLEYFTTADLIEQAREFKKANLWWDRLYKPVREQKSIWQQCKDEIKSLARMDRELVLEPFRWIFHGGQAGNVTWINNETPSGTIDGTNATFTLATTPNPSSSLLLTKNGQVLYQGMAYSISGRTVTFNAGSIPQPATTDDPVGDKIRAWYQVN